MLSIANPRRLGTRLLAAGLAATVLFTAGCSDDDNGTNAGVAASVTVTSGNNQTGTVGAGLAAPIVVTVRDQNGNPLSGKAVTFTATGGGTIGTQTVTTNAQGQAQTTFTLGGTAGTQTVTAVVAGVSAPATFTFTGNAGAASQLVVTSGNTQTGVVGVALTNPLVITVRDASGNPVSGKTVTFATTGGGTLATPTVTTNAQGQAQTNFTLGNTAGTQTVTASVAGITTPASFTFMGNAAVASSIVLVSGNNQTGAVGTALTQPLTLEVRDAFGNPVSGAAVTWTTSAGTFVGTPVATTTANGRATASLMLPTIPGPVTVTVRLTNNAAVTTTFTATAT
ncbi:MAG: Ig-like domain-containing protein [Gemmatimonadales bacterium]